MSRKLRKIAFILDEFVVPSPGQQLLDRFLIGYPRDGRFHRLEGCQIMACLAAGSNDLELNRRVRDFGLTLSSSPENAVADADAIVLVWSGVGTATNERTLRAVVANAPPRTTCFVHGLLGSNLTAAQDLQDLANKQGLALLAGTSLGVTGRLPDIDIEKGIPLRDALVVVQGSFLEAEFDGFECLLPIAERRRGGETGIRRLRFLEGARVWKAGERGGWPLPLLAAAISRSDTPQSGSAENARLWDVVGRGLVPKLARSPRALLAEHYDGLRTTIMVLDGVIADYNFAVRAENGEIISAQIFRPPLPGQHQFSRLAAVLEDYFHNGRVPWSAQRGVLVAGLLEATAHASRAGNAWIETPQLKMSYPP